MHLPFLVVLLLTSLPQVLMSLAPPVFYLPLELYTIGAIIL